MAAQRLQHRCGPRVPERMLGRRRDHLHRLGNAPRALPPRASHHLALGRRHRDAHRSRGSRVYGYRRERRLLRLRTRARGVRGDSRRLSSSQAFRGAHQRAGRARCQAHVLFHRAGLCCGRGPARGGRPPLCPRRGHHGMAFRISGCPAHAGSRPQRPSDHTPGERKGAVGLRLHGPIAAELGYASRDYASFFESTLASCVLSTMPP